MALEPLVIVPDGLGYDRTRRQALAEPSFVGVAVLAYVAEHFSDRRILIAPANKFGSPSSEHEVMKAWLMGRGCPNVETPTLEPARYIDTWGNAVELRRWLEARGEWPLGHVRLVVGFRHSRRARLCFLRNGFHISAVDAVSYRTRGIPIVPRLFYYNWPALHCAYEAVAWLRDLLRPAHTKGA